MNQNPFSDPWKIWKSFHNIHILYRSRHHVNTYAVVYVHSALFRLPSRCTIAERHNLLYSNPDQPHTVPEKIRYYRHKYLLHQNDVANALNMERTIYQSYEYNSREYYSLEVLEHLAVFYQIPPENLMDEYHRFLYHAPGIKIKQFRKQHGYTQEQLAEKLGVWRASVRAWEKEQKRISRKNYQKLVSLKNKSDNRKGQPVK